MNQSTLRVLCGLPAAGKSTWCAANGGSALLLSADAVREHGAQAGAVFAGMESRARIALQHGHDVLIDACSLAPQARGRWLAMAAQCDARAELVMFCTPGSVCRARDAVRAQPARVAWSDFCLAADTALRAVVREPWAAVLYVPQRLQAFAFK
jgi:predicted kinase